MKDWEREATARAARQITADEDACVHLALKPWGEPAAPVHAGRTKEMRVLHDRPPLDATPEELAQFRPWEQPVEPAMASRADGEGEHDWWLAGTKSDQEAPVTYFLWGCRKCHRRLATETPSKDAPFMADQCPPAKEDLRRAGVDEDCRQALVDAVHDL